MPEIANESLVDYYPIELLEPCATNPRQNVGDITELAETIGRMGVLQPLLIRQHPTTQDRWEVISGHRRLAAARHAGLTQVPCRACGCTDEQVAEIQIVENLQRADLSPVEEAAGYRRLAEDFGQSAEQIAGRVGKSRAYVYAKLKLLALSEEGLAALAAGHITESVALMLARIPGDRLQAKALAKLTQVTYGREAGEPMPFRLAKELLHREFTTDLRSAIWRLDDDTLVEGAGSCQACPKRSGNNRDEYPDVSDERVCMDPTCYASKRDAQLARLLEQAEKKGKVVPEKEASRALALSGGLKTWSTDFVELSAKPEGSDKTWAQLAKAHGIDVEREVIVDTRQGKNLLVARGDQLRAALVAAGALDPHKLNMEDADDGQDAFEEQADAFESANQAIAASALERLVQTPVVWRSVAQAALRTPARVQMKIAEVAGLPDIMEHAAGWGTGARGMAGAAPDLQSLHRLIAAAAIVSDMRGRLDEDASDERSCVYVFRSEVFDAACAEAGIDVVAERARIVAERAAVAPDPSVAAHATEPTAPEKTKRSRKTKTPRGETNTRGDDTTNTPSEVGCADGETEGGADA